MNIAFIASEPVCLVMVSKVGVTVSPMAALRVGICASTNRYTQARRRVEVAAT